MTKQETNIKDVVMLRDKNKIFPYAKIDPISNYEGKKINKFQLNNIECIENLAIGDTIKIDEFGEDTCNVEIVEKGNNRTPIILDVCDICFNEVEKKEDHLVCKNSDCAKQLKKDLNTSLKRFGVEIGYPDLEKLIEKAGVRNIFDIFMLDKNTIQEIGNYSNISSEKIYNSINSLLNTELKDYDLFHALNSIQISKNQAKKLFEIYNINDLMSMSFEEITNDETIGSISVNMDELYNELQQENSLLNITLTLFTITPSKKQKEKPLVSTQNNKDFVSNISFVGRIPGDAFTYKQIAKNLGYEIKENSFDENTIAIVYDGINSSVINKARKKGIKLIKYENFVEDFF